ncbi:MAG: ubiquinol-cytochrome c reductase iron-sulfur subunit, partial [Nitrospiraceae bacterium]
LIYPVMKYLMKPMYLPYDNRWIKVGNVNRIKVEDTGVQFKFRKKVKEAFMPEVEILKNVWLLKATPEVLDEVYKGEDMQFRDSQGSLIWTNKRAFPYVAYSGKCPHLGCGYKWRKIRKLPREIFLCPCHISIYDVSGKVLDGPAPRPLDPVPIRVSDNGDVEIIDVEFKAGVRDRIRIL